MFFGSVEPGVETFMKPSELYGVIIFITWIIGISRQFVSWSTAARVRLHPTVDLFKSPHAMPQFLKRAYRIFKTISKINLTARLELLLPYHHQKVTSG